MIRTSDPHFAERVHASFNRQNAMTLIQATLPVVEPGRTEIHLPHWDGVEQQHGFVHGGEKLIARGKVVRPGKTLIITQAEAFAVKDGRETLCALMQQTIMVMHGREEK